MEKWLNLSQKEKLEILNFSTYGIGLPDYVIEKDIWVTESLRKVFDTSFASHMIFKGGTSLSKAWGVIYRFSEDIDLAIDYGYLGFKDGLTRTQVNNLRKAAQVFVKDLFYPKMPGFVSHEPLNRSFNFCIQTLNVHAGSPERDPVVINCDQFRFLRSVLPWLVLALG